MILGLVLSLFPVSAGFAEESAEPLIAVILGSDKSPYAETYEGFRETLRRRQVDATYLVQKLSPDKVERGERLEEIVRREPDLLLVLGSTALEFAGTRIEDIPIVAGMILRKEDFRLVPGTTGVYLEFPPETHFAWLQRILPQARTVGAIYNRRENRQRIAQAERAAEERGLVLSTREVEDARELPPALKDLANRIDVLWGISDDVVLTPQTVRQILLFSFRQRIPFVGLSSAWVKAGAFYALDRDYRDIGRQCAEIALRALAGEAANEIPPEGPEKVIYSLNLKAARQMRIDLPASIIRNAAEVF